MRGSTKTLLLLLLVLIVGTIATSAAWIQEGNGVSLLFKSEIVEPIIVTKIKGPPGRLWPGSTASVSFTVSNLQLKPYIVNITVGLPWKGDGLSDGHGIDVTAFLVNGEDSTSDLLDDGVVSIALDGAETANVIVKIVVQGDAPAGPVDLTVRVLRSVVLEDPPKYIHLSWAVNDVYHSYHHNVVDQV